MVHDIRQKRCDISVVVPFYNEKRSIDELHSRLKNTLDALKVDYEIIFVDDGSSDGTLDSMRRIKAADSDITLVILTKNFGQTPALKAGIDTACGDIVITMDGDLEHSPEEIPLFVNKIKEGYDLVSGWRVNRCDNFFARRIPSGIANWFLKIISGVDIHDFGTTFKAYRRSLLNNIEMFGESHRFMPVLAVKVGARICEIPIKSSRRKDGRSHYGLGRTIRVFLDMIFLCFFMGYIGRPMFLFGFVALVFIGIGVGIPAFMLSLFFTGQIENLKGHVNLMLFSVLLILIGVQFLCFGVISEILTRIYHRSAGCDIYYVRKSYN